MGRNRQRYIGDVHSAALVLARSPEVDALVARLTTDRSADELTEAGGVLAGSWLRSHLACDSSELIAAGLLLSGAIDRDQLTMWLREGWRRAGGGFYDPSAR